MWYNFTTILLVFWLKLYVYIGDYLAAAVSAKGFFFVFISDHITYHNYHIIPTNHHQCDSNMIIGQREADWSILSGIQSTHIFFNVGPHWH